MLLPLDTLLTATLEGGLNHLLRRDPQSAARAQPLLGKVLRIEIRDLRTFWLLFSQDNVELFSRYEAQADAGITTTLGALPKLREKDQLTALIRAGEVDLQGDPALFNHFSQLLAELQIDWERELGHFTGRTLARIDGYVQAFGLVIALIERDQEKAGGALELPVERDFHRRLGEGRCR